MSKFTKWTIGISLFLTAGILTAANVPEFRLASGKLMVGDSNGKAQPVTISGDITISNTGVAAMGANAVVGADITDLTITSADLANTVPKYVKVTVSSAELLAINATPKTIVAAPGAGFTIVIHKALLVLNYNSAGYANNGLLGLYETDASGQVLTGTLTLASFLAQTADTQKELVPNISTTTGLTRLDNKAIVLTQATGESITGNSPVDVHLWYAIIPNGL